MSSFQLFANNAKATLASGIASNATSISLATGTGAAFPSPTGGDFFKLTFTQAGSNETSWEIATIVARSGDTLTVGVPGSASANASGRGADGTTAAAWSAADKAEQRVTAADMSASVIRAGTTGLFPFSSAPPGWLKSNGAAVSRTTYAALFGAIGTTFGAGDGSTTFNVPDDRGEFFRATDDGRGVDSGRAVNSTQGDEIKSHAHSTPAGSGGGYGAPYGYGSSFIATESTGGTETRPRNRAYLACIKY